MALVLPADFALCRCIQQTPFGGNMLFHRNNIGPDGNYDELIEELGLTSLRYPGGAISEEMFDIRNPNATVAIDPTTGDSVPIEPLSDVAGYAAEKGLTLTVVLPTRKYLSGELDELGHRLPAVDAEAVRTFVTDLVGGTYGAAKIIGLEIGNEYWGIGEIEDGSMTTLEYARVASEMTRILDETLATVPGGEDVSILVQMGTNYGEAALDPDYASVPRGAALDSAVRADYDLPEDVNFLTASGDINWTILSNHIIMQQMSNDGTLDKVDGVIAHIYSRYPQLESSRYRQLDIIEKTWGEELPEVEKWVTEWSRKAATDAFERDTDYGLKTAHEIVAMFSVMGQNKVEAAYYWTPQHNTVTALSKMVQTPEGEAPPLTAAGEMYKLMSEHIRLHSGLDMNPGDPNTNGIAVDGVNYYAYVKPAGLVFYVASESDSVRDVEMDFSTYVDAYDSVEVTRLGVTPGADPGNPQAKPVVTVLDPAESVQDAVLTTTLQPYEVVQLVVSGANLTKQLTEDLAAFRTKVGTPLDGLIIDPEDDLSGILPGDPDTDPDTETPPPDDVVVENPDEEPPPPEDDGGGVADLLFALGLPILLAVAFAL